jgi:hypothetical protein
MKNGNADNSIEADGDCGFCRKFRRLCMSHAIPKAAFKTLMSAGDGNAIGIPKGDGNAHLTSDSGAGLLLCSACEGIFNKNFDAPMTNALKELDNQIISHGFDTHVTFEANQLAHAVVATAWRICLSPAHMYSEVIVSFQHMRGLDALVRKPTSEILRHCSVKISRLADSTPENIGGFAQETMRQFIKAPEVYSIKTKNYGRFDRLAMEWTMFGFLVHLIVPRLPYPKSQKFDGLKIGSKRVKANPVNILDYGPLRDALVAGFAAQEEGRLTPGLKKRGALKGKK